MKAARVIRAVSREFNVTPDQMKGECRKQRLARARWCVAYVLYRDGYSSNQIGRALGNRDHSTILYGLRKLNELLEGPVSWGGDECRRAIAAGVMAANTRHTEVYVGEPVGVIWASP